MKTNSAGKKKMSKTRCTVKTREGEACRRPARIIAVTATPLKGWCRQHAVKTGLLAKLRWVR